MSASGTTSSISPSASPSWTSPGAGITTGYDGNSQTLRICVVFFCGLAIYNACELVAMIFLAFNRRSGLYFWSLLLTGIGIIPYSLGFLLKYMEITTGRSHWLAVVLLTIGWYPMITGESLVLWSRLNVIVSGRNGDKIIRYTKWMIIVNAICLHIPTTVLTVGSNGSTRVAVFERGYNVMEKIQMVGFFCQEVVLSSVYIIETAKILRTSLQPKHTRKTMNQLIAINIIILVMDLGLLGLECASLYILETLLKGLIYSIKLKLEFAILSKLVKFAGGSNTATGARHASAGFVSMNGTSSKETGEMDVAEFVDLGRTETQVTRYSRATETDASRRGARLSLNQSNLIMARFEHTEDVLSLPSIRSRSPSVAQASHESSSSGGA